MMFDALRDAISSWQTETTSTEPAFALWAVDPEPSECEIDEYLFMFLVEENKNDAYTLANRTGEHLEFENGIHVLQVDELFVTEVDDRLIPLRSCELLHPDDDRGRALPDDVTGKSLPPREFTREDLETISNLLD